MLHPGPAELLAFTEKFAGNRITGRVLRVFRGVRDDRVDERTDHVQSRVHRVHGIGLLVGERLDVLVPTWAKLVRTCLGPDGIEDSLDVVG
jgi:hypothetical protein